MLAKFHCNKLSKNYTVNFPFTLVAQDEMFENPKYNQKLVFIQRHFRKLTQEDRLGGKVYENFPILNLCD